MALVSPWRIGIAKERAALEVLLNAQLPPEPAPPRPRSTEPDPLLGEVDRTALSRLLQKWAEDFELSERRSTAPHPSLPEGYPLLERIGIEAPCRFIVRSLEDLVERLLWSTAPDPEEAQKLTPEHCEALNTLLDELYCLGLGISMSDLPEDALGGRPPSYLLPLLRDFHLLRRFAEEVIPDKLSPEGSPREILVQFSATDVEQRRLAVLLRRGMMVPSIMPSDDDDRAVIPSFLGESDGARHPWEIVIERNDHSFGRLDPYTEHDVNTIAGMAFSAYLLGTWRGWRRLCCEGWGAPCGRWIITKDKRRQRCARCRRRQQRRPEARG
jgi:hypothetical protein